MKQATLHSAPPAAPNPLQTAATDSSSGGPCAYRRRGAGRLLVAKQPQWRADQTCPTHCTTSTNQAAQAPKGKCLGQLQAQPVLPGLPAKSPLHRGSVIHKKHCVGLEWPAIGKI